MVSPCSFHTCFIPGLVKARQAFWSEITSDQFILDTVSHGLRIPFLDSPNCAPSEVAHVSGTTGNSVY